jgi:hypothetical protein
MPLLTVLGVVGLVAMVRRPNLRMLLVPVAGALAGVVVTLTIGYIAQRYTADAIPALVLTGSVGLHVAVARAHRWLVPVLVGLAAISVLLTSTFALRYQREWGFLIPEDHRAELVRFQYDTAPLLGERPQVGRGDELPPPEPAERFFVIGDCAATYWSKGETWEPVERMPEGGRFVLDLTLPAAFRGEAELVSTLDVVVEDDGEGAARIRFRHGDDESPAYAYTPGEPMRLDIVVDRRLGYVNVRRDGRMLFEPFYDGPSIDPELGDDVPGVVELVPRQPSACRAVTGGRSS